MFRSRFLKNTKFAVCNIFKSKPKLACSTMAADNDWKGVPISHIIGSQSPWGAPEFPLVQPGFNHAVLYHIPASGAQLDSPPKPQIGKEKWDQEHVRMPFSTQSLYPVPNGSGQSELKSRWDMIQEALSKPIRNSKELAETILIYNSQFKDRWQFRSLHQLFESLDEEESQYFFDVTLPEIAKLAIELPKLIRAPIPLLKQHKNRSVSLSQQQISSLLANAFFCTFPRRNTHKKDAEYSSYPFINFNALFNCTPSAHIMEKIKSICHYFRRVCRKVPVGVVTFSRRSVPPRAQPDWATSERRLADLPVHVDPQNTIEDAHGLIQVDFANKLVKNDSLLSRRSVPPRAQPDWTTSERRLADLPVHVDPQNTIEDAHGLIQVDFANKLVKNDSLLSRRSVPPRAQPDWTTSERRLADLPEHVDPQGTIEDAHGLIQVDFANKLVKNDSLLSRRSVPPRAQPDWTTSERRLADLPVHVDPQSTIEDAHGLIQVDFANKLVKNDSLLSRRSVPPRAQPDWTTSERRLADLPVHVDPQSTIEDAHGLIQVDFANKLVKNDSLLSRRSVPPRAQPDWTTSERRLADLPVHVDPQSTIEDAHGLIQVDFANKFLGGGVLGYGSVQEEIRFVICPELLISMLFTEHLRPNEALMMIGCEQFSTYSGYGHSFQWAGDHRDETPYDSSGRRRCAVLAIDALPFRSRRQEYRKEALDRELNKAWVGFSFYTSDDPGLHYPGVATGNWGCGAFGGTAALKSLIQMMALTQAGRPMAYYTFGDVKLRDDIVQVYNMLVKHSVTVGGLYGLILEYCKTDVLKNSLYRFLEKILDGKDSSSTERMMDSNSPESMECNAETEQYDIPVTEELALDKSPDLFGDDDDDSQLITSAKLKVSVNNESNHCSNKAEAAVNSSSKKILDADHNMSIFCDEQEENYHIMPDGSHKMADSSRKMADGSHKMADHRMSISPAQTLEKTKPKNHTSRLFEEMEKLDEDSGKLNLKSPQVSIFDFKNKLTNNLESSNQTSKLIDEMEKLDEDSGNLNLKSPEKSFGQKNKRDSTLGVEDKITCEVSPDVKKKLARKITDYFSKKPD